MVLYSRADSWLGWGESRESDNVMRSLGRIFQISIHGLVRPSGACCTGRKQARTAETARPLSIARSPRLICAGCRSCSAARSTSGAGGRLPQDLPAPLVSRHARPRQRPPLPGPVSRHIHAERRRLAADRAARHRQPGTTSTSRCRRPTWCAPRRFTSTMRFLPACCRSSAISS